MKTNIRTLVIAMTTFIIGFQLKGMITNRNSSVGRVTSIGGIFFKSKNTHELKNWYKENLGIKVNEYGAVFEWKNGNDSMMKGFTQWSPFNEKTKYFEPSTKDFMINYRVDNLDVLLNKLKKNHVTILDTIEHYEYGNFAHILDNEGNKIELWEANDKEYEKMGIEMKLETNK